ncbi:RNA polymerase sigma factor [Janthinobacterium sp.]|uniref:RNA polymerase sigma factor n=1 Tax=Janthinobacterium sp. TaxID=1871054 RepID=UPI00258FF45F|nr:RNA polymerase sigma factor [Janthinobacterium sp.]MCX7289970.1 RNA polymerase sigma factor [Janthinobacterium sp.]
MSMPDLRTKLKRHLSSRYAVLRWRLERVVGCKHNAADALQETWVAPGPAAAPVHNPDAYLLRMAANIATDAYRRDRIIVTEREREELMHMADETGDDISDPARIVSARLDVQALDAALADLSPRRRAILTAARVDGLLNAEIAERFGISVAMVKKELQAAMQHCKTCMADAEAAQRSDVSGRRKY